MEPSMANNTVYRGGGILGNPGLQRGGRREPPPSLLKPWVSEDEAAENSETSERERGDSTSQAHTLTQIPQTFFM